MALKECNKCNSEKSLDLFYTKGIYKDNTCIECRKQINELKRIEKRKHPKKTCTKCKKVYALSGFYSSNKVIKSECKLCTQKDKKERELKNGGQKQYKKKKKERKDAKDLESIFEMEHRLKDKAKVLEKENVKTEAWKLANGYKWVYETVKFTKTTTKKQRVLRKIE